MEKLERNHLNEIYTKDVVGVPMTPGHWTDAPDSREVTRITMTAGGGMGGSKWTETVDSVSQRHIEEAMSKNLPLLVRTYDGRSVLLNLRFMVKAENFTMVTRHYESHNKNFKTGVYTCRWLLPLNTTVRFANEYLPE